MILVIGDAMIDRYIEGRITRLAQEAPIPVFEPGDNTVECPGGAANVAANIDAMGERSVLISGAISIKTRYTVKGDILLRVDNDVKTLQDPDEIIAGAAQHVADAAAIVISDYGKGVVTEPVARWAVVAALARGIPIIVDPKPPRLMDAWRDATVVKMNEYEARDAGDLANVCHGWVITTHGANGMMLWGCADACVVMIPACAREVFSVIGAGDTISAGLAVGLSRGWPMERAARFANAAAGVVVGKRGTATATFAEVEAALGASVDP